MKIALFALRNTVYMYNYNKMLHDCVYITYIFHKFRINCDLFCLFFNENTVSLDSMLKSVRMHSRWMWTSVFLFSQLYFHFSLDQHVKCLFERTVASAWCLNLSDFRKWSKWCEERVHLREPALEPDDGIHRQVSVV